MYIHNYKCIIVILHSPKPLDWRYLWAIHFSVFGNSEVEWCQRFSRIRSVHGALDRLLFRLHEWVGCRMPKLITFLTENRMRSWTADWHKGARGKLVTASPFPLESLPRKPLEHLGIVINYSEFVWPVKQWLILRGMGWSEIGAASSGGYFKRCSAS